jgi:lysyl endopeptidase
MRVASGVSKWSCAAISGAALGAFAVAALAVDPPQPIDSSGIAEAQMYVSTEGPTYEEYSARQAALNQQLIGELPPAALNATVSIEVTQMEINAINQAVPNPGEPLQIGLVRPVDPRVTVAGLNRTQADKAAGRGTPGELSQMQDGGFVWALPVASADAGAIRVHIENFSLPAGAELYFYTRDGQAFGPYTGAGPNGSGEFWTASVFGSEGILQIRVPGPADNATLRQVSLEVTGVGHITAQFADQMLQATAAGFCGNVACIVDASCYSGANAIKDAYAKMEWISGAFIYTCTTGLLADNNPTQDNFSLTAHHCISTSTNAANINFYWRFRTSSCNGTCPTNNGWPYQTSGSTISATGATSAGDFTLLHLNSAPPSGSVFMGWTNVAVANTNGVALHRVSNPQFGPQVYNEQSVDTSAPTCSSLPRGPIIYSRDTLGGTDGGSSGSPVVNASNQVVGQLYGACGSNVNDPCDSASNATVDGAFAYYWPSVCPYLDPSNCGGGGCSPAGASCTANSDCCSNSCKGRPGAKTCK